jgi:hypothetical protein
MLVPHAGFEARADMGYFDALASPYFRTARDGRRLFFPPSIPGRGYVIGSEQAFERLQRQVKRYAAGSLVLIFGSGLFVSYLASFVIAALLVPVSIIGARYLTRGMQPSEEKPEKLSWYESFASQARAHSAESLWWLEICSLAFVCGGIFVFVVNPEETCRAGLDRFFRPWRGDICFPAFPAES